MIKFQCLLKLFSFSIYQGLSTFSICISLQYLIAPPLRNIYTRVPIWEPTGIDNYFLFDFLWKQLLIFCEILLPFGTGVVNVWNAVDVWNAVAVWNAVEVSSSWRQRLSPEMQLLQVSSIVGQLSRSRHSDRAVTKVNHLQLSKLLQRRKHSSADSISSEWKASFMQRSLEHRTWDHLKFVSLLLYNIYSGQNMEKF